MQGSPELEIEDWIDLVSCHQSDCENAHMEQRPPRKPA